MASPQRGALELGANTKRAHGSHMTTANGKGSCSIRQRLAQRECNAPPYLGRHFVRGGARLDFDTDIKVEDDAVRCWEKYEAVRDSAGTCSASGRRVMFAWHGFMFPRGGLCTATFIPVLSRHFCSLSRRTTGIQRAAQGIVEHRKGREECTECNAACR